MLADIQPPDQETLIAILHDKAEAWFNDEWWGWIEERFGARPTLTYFDHYVTVDNAAGEIRVDGVATTAAAAE